MDTAYLAALLRQRDQFHLRAKRWDRYLEQRNVRLIVTEAVLWEWLNGCCERALRAQAAQGYRFLHQDERVEVIPFQPAQMEAAFALYEARSDKEWSMTDCLSFLVLQE